MYQENENVMPAGAMLPQDHDDDVDDEVMAQGQEAEAPEESGSEGPGEEPLLLGKFKSVDDLAKSYQELESLTGRQSSEVGDLRRQMQEIQQQVAARQQEAGPEEPDFDAQLKEIERQVEEGEISLSRALGMSAEVTAKRTAAEAQKAFLEYDRQRQTQSQHEKFLQEHPDFLTAQQNGLLQQYKQQNPFHDDFSAYWHWKADQEAQAKLEAEKSGYQRGKQEVTELAKGSEAARKTLAKPGSDIRKTVNSGKRLTPYEIKQSMLSRLDET